MSWILTFNKFILVPVITEWSKRDDILMLDSALCNHTDREYYQSLMSEYNRKYLGALLDGLTVDLSPRLCDWIALRFSESFSADCVKSVILKVQEQSMNEYCNLDQTTRDRVMAFLAPIESLQVIQCEKYKLCESLFPLFHNITKFSVTINCYSTTAVHATRLLESAAQNFSNLRVFHLSGCRHVSDEVLSAIVRQCKHRIELNVRGCSSLKGSFLLTMITTRSHIRMLNLLENWTRYLLQYVLCAKGTESSHFGNNALIHRTLMWYSGSQLKSVYIISLDGNTPQLMDVFDCCPSLTKLVMTIVNWDVNIDVQQRIAIAWKQLTVLVMAIWEIEDFLILVKLVCAHGTALQELKIMHRNHHRWLTVPGCEFNCHNLEKLTMHGPLSDEMLLGMLSQSRKFRKLDVVGSGAFPTVANISLAIPYLYNLEEFRIEHLSKASLNCILRYCSNLIVLCVPFNFKLPTDGSVFLPSLATLETRCNKLDGVWLVCPNLRELSASNITQALAKQLVEHLPRLRVLHCGVEDWRSKQCIQNSKLKIN